MRDDLDEMRFWSTTRNEISGNPDAVVQAAAIAGGVHIHRAAPATAASVAVERSVERWDPFDLDVHRAIAAPAASDLPGLPRYVPREHDDELDVVLRDVTAGVMVVLTGESSTGKTRALYEAVTRHDVLRTWPLVYPRTTDELLRLQESRRFREPVVLWLNETHNYLDGQYGETAAAWLRSQLDGSRSAPVVVLGTLWPQYWSDFVAAPSAGGLDQHATVRALLQHVVRRVRVAERFSIDQLDMLRADRTVDPRVAAAVTTSGPGGRVIQTLAGGPALVVRYDNPDDPDDRYAAAVVTAAIDARRMGYQGPLTATLLTAAADGYLGDEDRIDPLEDWCIRGVRRATRDALHGITALVPVRARAGAGPADGYELHDYLEQHGRTIRRDARTAASLWQALVTCADAPADQRRLAEAAYRRLLFRYADPLHERWRLVADRGSQLGFVDVLMTYGRLDEAFLLLIGTWDDGAGTRLVDLLVRCDRTEDAIALLTCQVEDGHASAANAERLVSLLVGAGQVSDALVLLRRLAAHEDEKTRRLEGHGFGYVDQLWATDRLAELLAEYDRTDELRQRAQAGDPYAGRRLVDLLVERGQWDAALAELRSGAKWARDWMIGHLAAAGDVEALRQLCDTEDPRNDELWQEALLANGQVDEALARHGARGDNNAPSERLIDAMVDHGRADEVADLLLRTRGFRHSVRWSYFVASMTERGQAAELVRLLRRGLASGLGGPLVNREPFAARPQLDMLLADQLASQDRWAEVLELLRNAGGWSREWLPRQLRKLGRTDQLRRLADSGNGTARQELVEILLEQGRDADAMSMLRGFVGRGRSRSAWPAMRLAGLLADRGEFDELATRAAAGDVHAATVLVDWANRDRLPDAGRFLAVGLSPDGSFPPRPVPVRVDGNEPPH